MFPEHPFEQSYILESVESQSWLSIYRNCPEDFKRQYRVRCDEGETAHIFQASGIDILAFNRVLMLGMQTVPTMNDVEDIKRSYLEHGVRRFFVQVSPNARPEGLEAMLIEAGFRHYNNWVKWFMPLNKEWAENDEVSILKIKPDMANAFEHIVSKGFDFDPHVGVLATTGLGKPGWAHFVASVDGAPAGCAAGYYDGSVCALGWAATLPEYRGRGIQSALISHRLNHLRKAGCNMAVLETAEDLPERPSHSYHNMERNGFTKAYLRKNYIFENE